MILILVGRLTQFALAFLSVRLMTTVLTPIEVGKATLITTGTAFFALFLVNPVGMFINRRIHPWLINGNLKNYFHHYCKYLFYVALFAALLTWSLLVANIWDIGLSPIWTATLIAGSLIFNTINQTLIPSMNMLERVRPFVIFTIGTLALGLIFSYTLVKWLHSNAITWLSGSILSQMVFSFLAYKVFFREISNDIRTPIENDSYWRLYNFAWPISIAVGLNWLHMQGYRFILANQFGLAELGLFSAGYTLAASLTTACESITTAWFQPRFYREIHSSSKLIRKQAWSKYASTMLPLSILASSGIFMTSPYLATIMLGPDYQSVAPYVMMGALAEWGRTLFNIFSLDSHANMNTRRLIIPSALGMSATYVALIAPIQLKMLNAVPLAVLAGCLLMSVVIRLTFSKNEDNSPIDWNITFITLLGVFGVSLIFEVCRQYLLVRFGDIEPFVGLPVALSLWGSFSWFLFRRYVS